jgi:hypothetical protein
MVVWNFSLQIKKIFKTTNFPTQKKIQKQAFSLEISIQQTFSLNNLHTTSTFIQNFPYN